jgi:hypothetical protein
VVVPRWQNGGLAMNTNFNNAALSDIELDAISGGGDDKVTVADVKKLFAEHGDSSSTVLTPQTLAAWQAAVKAMKN